MDEQIILLKSWIESREATAIDHQTQISRLDIIKRIHENRVDDYRKEMANLIKQLEDARKEIQKLKELPAEAEVQTKKK
jgi:uncharacterized protein YeeX (DUF496 family)